MENNSFHVGDHVFVTHPLGEYLAVGTVTACWKERTIIRGKVAHIGRAIVEFPDGGSREYPQSWLTMVTVENIDTPCVQCGGPNVNLTIKVSIKTPTGSSQIATFACDDCEYELYPVINLRVGTEHDEPEQSPVRRVDEPGT